MSELANRLKKQADRSAEYWADLIGDRVVDGPPTYGDRLASDSEMLMRRAAIVIEELEEKLSGSDF